MLKNLLTILFAIIITLFAIEAFLVLLERNGKFNSSVLVQPGREYGLYQDDETLGWRYTPKFFANAQYGNAVKIEKINSHGWRNKEVNLTKKKNDFRIAAIGCSRTFGYGVNIEETYGYQLEKLLSAKEGANAEVINFGVNGYGIDQMALNYRKNVHHYNPDLVIVQLYAPNVIRALFTKMFSIPKPKFIVENNELRIVNYPVIPNKWRRQQTWLLDHVILYRLIHGRLQTIVEQKKQALKENIKYDQEVHDLIRRIFLYFESLVEEDGAEMIVFLWNEEDQWIHDILREAGLQVFNIFDYADQKVWRQKGPLNNPPPVEHWSAIGNKYIAEGVYNYMKEYVAPFNDKSRRQMVGEVGLNLN